MRTRAPQLEPRLEARQGLWKPLRTARSSQRAGRKRSHLSSQTMRTQVKGRTALSACTQGAKRTARVTLVRSTRISRALRSDNHSGTSMIDYLWVGG